MATRWTRFCQARFVLTGLALALLLGAWYFAYLSGGAMNAAGDTERSLNLSAIAAWLGIPALLLGVSLIAARQTGSEFVRAAKIAATLLVGFALEVSSFVLIQQLAAP